MSWMNPLLQFATGFIGGFVDGYAESQAGQRRASDAHGSDFGDAMQALSEQTNIPLVHIGHNSATFRFTTRDTDNIVLVAVGNGAVTIGVCSNIRFRRGVPEVVCRALARRNGQLPNCDYDVLRMDDGDVIYVRGQLRIRALSPASFVDALIELVPRISGVDAFLVEEGFA